MTDTIPTTELTVAQELELLRAELTDRLDRLDAAVELLTEQAHARPALVARMLRVAADAAENPPTPTATPTGR